MRFQILLSLGLVAVACATPLMDKRPGSLKVVDIPADLFAEESENVEAVQAPEQKPIDDVTVLEEKVEAPAAPAQVPVEPETKTEDKKETVEKPEEGVVAPASLDKEGDKKNPDDDAEEIDKPQVFGFRLPTIIILRRPAIFDDPFSNLFPFFPSFNRRPAFAPPAPVPADNRDVDIRDGQARPSPSSADSSPSEQRPVGGSGNIADVMYNVRQHMDNLFSSLFAPNAGLFPNRQFFPRPLFPPVPIDSAEEFDKLPDNYKNSTHETKVVDGQVVEVNKTVHRISGNNSNGFFQFSVIKIRPSDAPVPEGKPEEVPPAAIGASPESGATPEVTTIKAQQEAEMNNPALNEVDNADKVSTQKTGQGIDEGLL